MITLHNSKGKQIKLLKDNTKLAATVKEYGLVTKEFFTLTTDQGIELNGWMMKPPAFDSRQKYPVFMTQYSGPNSNEVLDQWGGRDQLWHGICLLYTSDAADERSSVDLGGRRILKKKKIVASV